MIISVIMNFMFAKGCSNDLTLPHDAGVRTVTVGDPSPRVDTLQITTRVV